MSKAIFYLALSAMFLLLLTSQIAYAFKNNIVAAWPMEEGSGKTLKDITGNHNPGEIKGKVDRVDGKYGKALRFDGSTGYVQIPFSAKANLVNKGDFTFACWFNTETLWSERGDYLAGFQQMDANGTGRTWMGIKADDKTYSYLGNGDTFGEPPEVGQWYHFAVVVTEAGATDTIQVYSNGKPGGNPSNRGMEDCEGDYLMGCHKAMAVINFWEGIIDEVAFLNKALSEDEIQQLMERPLSGILSVENIDKLPVVWGYIK